MPTSTTDRGPAAELAVLELLLSDDGKLMTADEAERAVRRRERWPELQVSSGVLQGPAGFPAAGGA